jgi:type IV pilus assembly protein PilB
MSTTPRPRLGDMLVAAGAVTQPQLDDALGRQRGSGKRLGELLVELGHVSEHQLAQVLSNQLSIPWVNLHHVDFSRELLNLIPGELAERVAMVPVYVRRIRKQGDTLFVATDDPLNDTSLALVAQHAAMPVKPMVAGSTDVRNAIRAYYGRDIPVPAERTEPKRALIASIPPMELVDDIEILLSEPEAVVGPPTEEIPRLPNEPDLAEPAKAPATEPAEPEAEPLTLRRPKKKGPKMITLTLLDGSKVRLPAPASPESDEAEEQLTTRDLLTALVARTQGKDVSRVLPDAHWESLFAALLSILMRKGLVADWEFVEEWKKHRPRPR